MVRAAALVCAVLALLTADVAPTHAGRWERGMWEHAWSAQSFRRAEAKELRWAHWKAFLRHQRGY